MVDALKYDPKQSGLFEHLAELRGCLIRSIVAIFIGTLMSYIFAEHAFSLLAKPFYDTFAQSSLIGTGPAEAFLLKVKLSCFCGVLLALPYLFFEVWRFIAPGLYESEKKMVLPFIFFTTLCFLAGVWFCYSWVIPYAFAFFHSQYVSIQITPTIKMDEHLTMMLQGLFGFGVIFEMPVVAFFLGRLGLIDHHMLIRGTRYAILAIFILAAILTPPDVVTQCIMAAPLLLLYGVSILVVKFTAKQRGTGCETTAPTTKGS